MSYSPEPWTAVAQDADEFWFESGYYAIMSGNQTVAVIGMGAPGAAANARIVARAPALYVAFRADAINAHDGVSHCGQCGESWIGPEKVSSHGASCIAAPIE